MTTKPYKCRTCNDYFDASDMVPKNGKPSTQCRECYNASYRRRYEESKIRGEQMLSELLEGGKRLVDPDKDGCDKCKKYGYICERLLANNLWLLCQIPDKSDRWRVEKILKLDFDAIAAQLRAEVKRIKDAEEAERLKMLDMPAKNGV